MQIVPLEEVVRRYVVGVIRTYLEGNSNLKWAMGCIRKSGAPPTQIHEAIVQHKGYGDLNCWRMLADAFLA